MQAKRIWEALQGYPARGRARRGCESRGYVSRWDATGWGNVLMLTCSLSSADSESRWTVAVGATQATRGAPRSPLFFGMESSPYANGASGVKLDESANLAPASTTRPATQASHAGLKYPVATTHANQTRACCIALGTIAAFYCAVCALLGGCTVPKSQLVASWQEEAQFRRA